MRRNGKNRLLTGILIGMILTAGMCMAQTALAACEYGHTPVTKTVTAPTCQQEGMTRTDCAVCGAHLYDTTVYKTDHNWSAWQRVTEPTCEKEGRDERSCMMCGKTEIRAVGKTSHTKTELVITAPTCTAKGSKNIVCKVCGVVLQSNLSIPAKGHAWSEWGTTKAATCTADGEKQRTCADCGKTEKARIAAGGHQWSNWKAAVKETCLTEGQYTRSCAKCNLTETKTVAAIAHKHTVWKTVKAATTTAGGREEQYCKDCGILLKTRDTAPALMKQNTMCTLGIRLRDAGVEGDLWYMFTPFDASSDGVYTYPLVASNLFTVGTLTLAIRDGKAAVTYRVDDPEFRIEEEFFTILPSIDAIHVYEPEQLKAAYGMRTGQWIDLRAYFGDDTALVLYMNCRVTYTYNAATMTTLRYDSNATQTMINAMRQLMD